MSNLVFSTGKLQIGMVGGTLGNSDIIIAIQDVSLGDQFSEALVREAAQINQFAIADTQYDHEITLDFTTQTLPSTMIPYATGATASTAGGITSYTPGQTAKPQYCQGIFTAQLPDGTPVVVTIPRGKIIGFPVTFGRDKFVDVKLKLTYRPDPNNFQPVTYAIGPTGG